MSNLAGRVGQSDALQADANSSVDTRPLGVPPELFTAIVSFLDRDSLDNLRLCSQAYRYSIGRTKYQTLVITDDGPNETAKHWAYDHQEEVHWRTYNMGAPDQAKRFRSLYIDGTHGVTCRSTIDGSSCPLRELVKASAKKLVFRRSAKNRDASDLDALPEGDDRETANLVRMASWQGKLSSGDFKSLTIVGLSAGFCQDLAAQRLSARDRPGGSEHPVTSFLKGVKTLIEIEIRDPDSKGDTCTGPSNLVRGQHGILHDVPQVKRLTLYPVGSPKLQELLPERAIPTGNADVTHDFEYVYDFSDRVKWSIECYSAVLNGANHLRKKMPQAKLVVRQGRDDPVWERMLDKSLSEGKTMSTLEAAFRAYHRGVCIEAAGASLSCDCFPNVRWET